MNEAEILMQNDKFYVHVLLLEYHIFCSRLIFIYERIQYSFKEYKLTTISRFFS